ncbi:retrotransposon protein, putative, Ty3-gypsy subclass [Cucumis melo var. makuwa]|uniref:Retrotransposon protein, putative, Ty3-gypsy subclass n=1 Tax=Cucumis melo var. makuwa TaxID=1194695 RepID=A0A5D3D4J1_CUCMM|nr:retrotransposon protein, putative, Ty3-gypsy subclass [Cucumis melo var. makuwa]TYK18465.1 retrotransposon protein, putative, Ty3-gypsy subclass [Cucumis melo var. makuwa]
MYKMTLAGLQELKVQFQELLDKAVFMDFMDRVFENFLDTFVIVFQDSERVFGAFVHGCKDSSSQQIACKAFEIDASEKELGCVLMQQGKVVAYAYR